MAGAIAQGLKKKAAILAKALQAINAAKQDGFSHAQIHAAITAGGLELTPAYYENLYAREMRKHLARKAAIAAAPPPPASAALSPLARSEKERALLLRYRSLPPKRQSALLDLIKAAD